MKKYLLSIVSVVALLPLAAFAQINTVGTLLAWLASLINALGYIIISLAVLAFLYGVFRFVASAGDEEARKTGRSFMIWGIVGIAVMVSVWGLVYFLTNTFGISNIGRGTVDTGGSVPGTQPPNIPVAPGIN